MARCRLLAIFAALASVVFLVLGIVSLTSTLNAPSLDPTTDFETFTNACEVVGNRHCWYTLSGKNNVKVCYDLHWPMFLTPPEHEGTGPIYERLQQSEREQSECGAGCSSATDGSWDRYEPGMHTCWRAKNTELQGDQSKDHYLTPEEFEAELTKDSSAYQYGLASARGSQYGEATGRNLYQCSNAQCWKLIEPANELAETEALMAFSSVGIIIFLAVSLGSCCGAIYCYRASRRPKLADASKGPKLQRQDGSLDRVNPTPAADTALP